MKFKLKEWIANVTANLADLRPLIKYKTYTYQHTGSLAAGAAFNIVGNDVNASAPTGYSVLGIRLAYSSTGSVSIEQCRLHHTTGQFVRCRNQSTSAITSSFYVYVSVAYIRTGYLENAST